MWVFGYGSLMWDHWEKDFQYKRRVLATLEGYSRTFNKASVKNWGTRSNPGPTLNLVLADGGGCQGIAFSFDDGNRDAVMAYLGKREGGFDLRPLPVTVDGGAKVTAIVPIYTGKNLITGKTMAELVAMARAARGTSGACSEYVLNIADHLVRSGITDAVVADFANALKPPPPATG